MHDRKLKFLNSLEQLRMAFKISNFKNGERKDFAFPIIPLSVCDRALKRIYLYKDNV